MTKQELMRKLPQTQDKPKMRSASKPVSKGSVPLSEIPDAEDLESELVTLLDAKTSIDKKPKRNRSLTQKMIKI